MAEPTLTTPSATPPTSDTLPDEGTATHGKKAQIVAISLLALIIIGLVAQSWIQLERRAERDRKDAADTTPTVQDSPNRTMDDFRKAQQAAADALAARNRKNKEETQRTALLEKASGATLGTNPTPAPEADELSPEHIHKVFAADELRRALTARRAAIATNIATTGTANPATTRHPAPVAPRHTGAGLPPPPPVQPSFTPRNASGGAPSDIARANAASDTALQNQRNVAARNIAMLNQARELGTPIPPGLEQQVAAQARRLGLDPANPNATPASPPNAPAAYDPAARLPTAARAQRVPNRPTLTSALTSESDTFGEPAQNRAFRTPGAAGPRPGEKLMPTTTIISSVLDMDVLSDYDGNWKAVVQRPVYDTTLEHILIPAGTRVHGKTRRATAVNEVIQNRMGFSVLWAVRPDGKRIDFRRAAGVDHAGVAAVKDQVDRHVLAQVFGVLAYAVVGLGPSTQDFGANPNSAPDAAIRDATQQGRTLGRNFAAKYLSIVPTVTIRAGTPMKIFLEDDIYVAPWSEIPSDHYTRVR